MAKSYNLTQVEAAHRKRTLVSAGPIFDNFYRTAVWKEQIYDCQRDSADLYHASFLHGL